MSFIKGADRSQGLLLPESVEEYVGPEHPVRAIDAFVDALDLGRIGFGKAVPAATGRPPYEPGDLLKLYLWGYFNRVCSSRRLERECGRNLELLWLLRQLAPDFKTIADFRRDHPQALKGVFRQFVLLCRELGLYGRELVAIDGTKLKASNHPARRADARQLQAWIEQIDARIAEYLQTIEENDRDLLGAALPPSAPPVKMAAKLAALRRRKEHFMRVLAVATASGQAAPVTDPECQRMKKVGLGYNAQIAVDAQHHLIAVAQLADRATDHEQLPLLAAQAVEVLQSPACQVVADAGYFDQQAVVQAAEAGVECFVPRPEKGHAAQAGVFRKSAFVYEASQDGYRCPAGQLLVACGALVTKHGLLYQRYGNPAACRACALRAQCTKTSCRRIQRWEKEAVLAAVAARMAAHPEILQRRKTLVEHPFGTIKFWWQQGAVLTRGRRSVEGELSLSALAYNLKRVLAVLGVAGFRAGLAEVKKKVRQGGKSSSHGRLGVFCAALAAQHAPGWLALHLGRLFGSRSPIQAFWLPA